MGEDGAIAVVDRSTTSFGLEILRIRSESGDQTVALESFGLSANVKGRLALDQVREIEKRANSVSGVSSPVLLRLHGVRRLDGKHFVEREDLPGGVYLVDYLKDKTAAPQTVVGWALALAGLAQEYEKAGLDLRGISDRNVLVAEDGTIRVVDPGVAVILRKLRGDSEDPDNFIAPEGAYEDAWTTASDMFVIGILMYEALTGVKPFDDPSPENIRENIVHKKHTDPRYLNPEISERVGRVVDKLLQKSPEQRFSSLNELCLELQSIIDQSDFTSAPHEREALERARRRAGASDKVWKARRWLNRNRAGVLVAGIVVLALVVLRILNPPTPPVVTPEMTADEVVQLYYVSLANSDSVVLEQVLSDEVQDRSAIINRASAVHVITKMQDIQFMTAPVIGTGETRPVLRPYTIEGVEIQSLGQSEQDGVEVARFSATYTETYVDQGDMVTVKKRDELVLKRIQSLWKVTSIQGEELEKERVPLGFE
ncbi:MAG: protein kinase [Firmicutes bacterium]|nr:protein kinase [Bacillota bacterium]